MLAWDCVSREGFSGWVVFLQGRTCQNRSKEKDLDVKKICTEKMSGESQGKESEMKHL